ncbi:MAG: PEGA domain-containing protein [Acidobacteriia bacterium]|nr:PEGA domain-containing protein [Terriglobia bacterium]
MYKQFFGLKENPFNVSPDPRYLCETDHTREALACLTYCVQARKGFAMLTGDVGTGKTTLLNKVLEDLRRDDIATAFVFNPRLNPFQFLDYMMADFSLNFETQLKSHLLAQFNQWLLERHEAGSTTVLIVDEAQDASAEVLEEIRLLTNLETASEKLLQIILSGQVELEVKLRLPEFRQLRQRITMRAKTHPLSLEEAHRYVAERLRVAGSDGRQIFAPEAIEAAHRYAEGIPRVINILCEDSLVSAFADHKPIVSRQMVETIARELELDLYPPTAPPPAERTGESVFDSARPAAPGAAKPQTRAPEERRAPFERPAVPPPTAIQVRAEAPKTVPPVSDAPTPAPRMTLGAAPAPATPSPAAKATADEELRQVLRAESAHPKPSTARPVARPPTFGAAFKEERTSPVWWVLLILACVAVGAGGTFYLLERRPTAPRQPSAVNQGVAPDTPTESVAPETPSATNAAPAPSSPPSGPVVTAPAKSPEVRPAETKPKSQRIEARVRPRAPRPERPQEAPAVTPGVGQLSISSNVPGARITVDGHTSPEWVTPYVFTAVPVGSYRVVVSKNGYEAATGSAKVEEGRTASFKAQLTSGGGEINIVTNPPALEVSIDGGPFAPSPVQASVSAGAHTYRIKLPSSRIYEGTFEMRNGGIITRRVDFAGGDWLAPAPSP